MNRSVASTRTARHGRTAIALHGLTGVALLAQIVLGFLMTTSSPRGTLADHLLAALKHVLGDRDEVFSRICPNPSA